LPWQTGEGDPLTFNPQRHAIPIAENGEPLVALGALASTPQYRRIFTSAVYAGEHRNSPYGYGELEGALLSTWVRRGVADQLVQAQQILDQQVPGVAVVVYDGYRQPQVQAALHAYYLNRLRQVAGHLSEERLLEIAAIYVHPASTDPACPSPHLTGGSVDWGLMRVPASVCEQAETLLQQGLSARDARELDQEADLESQRVELLAAHAQGLDMGVPFDWGDAHAHASYFERHLTELEPARQQVVVANRRLLFWLGRQVGFVQFPDEVWHVSSGIQLADCNPARYGLPSFGAAEQTHEHRRRQTRAQREAQGIDTAATTLPPAARIAPTVAPE
jgi:D-alanyl-D-alanine dipeptidase